MPIDLLNSFDIGFINCSTDGIINTFNNAAFTILNLNGKFNSPEELQGENIRTLIGEYGRMIGRARSEGLLKNLELSFQGKNGTRKNLLHTLQIDEEDGSINIMVRDNTMEKKCEQELTRSKLEMVSILDLIPDIVYRLDRDGNITYINNGVIRYGYSPEEMIGSKFIDIVHPDDRDQAIYRINERRTGERRTSFFHVRLITRSENSVPFELESMTITHSAEFIINSEGIYLNEHEDKPEFFGTQGIARDISVKAGSDRLYYIDENKYHYILDRLEDGLFEFDREGKIIYCNESLGKMMGYDRSEIIDRKYHEFLKTENEKMIIDDFRKISESDEVKTAIDLKLRRKDGRDIQVEGSISKLINRSGEVTGFFGSIRDVTRKKKMEEDLFRARKLEAIGIFSGGIAHDYNNALTTIIGNISLAKMEIQGGNSDILDILNDAEEASIRVKDLTHKLSTLSKGGKPVKRPVDICVLIKEVVDSVSLNFSGEVFLELPDNLKAVEVDEFQIGHMLEYILGNAVDAVENNGIIRINATDIIVEKEESHHEITLQTGNYVKITIEDNGCGIDDENIDLIFDPYFSTHESRSGMGLAICYAVIKRHSGYIDVQSEKGKGSVFSVYLPVDI